MKRLHVLSIAGALTTAAIFSLNCVANDAKSTNQYQVLIDPSAVTQFGSNEALMRYSYTVIPTSVTVTPNTRPGQSAIEGEGTLNFKNALENQSTTLSAFSPLRENKMTDITMNTATITVANVTYTATRNNATIKANGYPYTIAYDKDKNQLQIINKDKVVILTFASSEKPAEPAKTEEKKAPAPQKPTESNIPETPKAPDTGLMHEPTNTAGK